MEMPSVVAVIRKEKISKKTGEMPVCIRITKNREHSYKTIFKIKPEYWDSKSSLVKKSHPNSFELNDWLQKSIAEIKTNAWTLNKTSNECNLSDLKNLSQSKISYDFFEYVDKHLQIINKNGKIGLYKRYKVAMKKFQLFVGKETLPLGKINLKMLNDFETFLKVEYENCPNTITANFKPISKYLKLMYREYKLNSDNNPFLDYKYKHEKAQSTYLENDELERLLDLKLTPKNPLFDAREVFILESFTGLRISDILTLKWKHCTETEIVRVMRKTNRTIEIPLADKIQRMIEMKRKIVLKYCGEVNPEKYVFNILKQDLDSISPLDAHNAISSATVIINKKLKQIATLAKIDKKISTHTGRHTFATSLSSKKVDLYVISKLLGHTNIATTQIYARVVNDKKRDAVNLLNN